MTNKLSTVSVLPTVLITNGTVTPSLSKYWTVSNSSNAKFPSLSYNSDFISKISFAFATSNGIFTLYSHFYTPEKITITDISGKTIQAISQLNEKYNTINLEGFLSGIYFAKITINGNEVVKKLIKH